MAEGPSLHPEEQQFIGCPFCTIQIPADASVCPHCRKILPPTEKLLRTYSPKAQELSGLRRLLFAGGRFDGISDLWDRYGKWIKVAAPVMAGFALLYLVFGVWVDYEVLVVPNAQLPISAKKDVKDKVDILTIFVTNRGEDIPDLSLKSIGVVVEFNFRDGRREKKTVFPKTEHRGEGAILSGETGSYEIAVPTKGLKEIVLRGEIVDLGMGRTLIPPSGVRRGQPGEGKRSGR